MRDMHCHVLPGVDDGARDMRMSLAMLDAARDVGVTSIVCTPHARDPYFDYDAMRLAFEELSPYARERSVPLPLGFEVAHAKLVELGGEEWAPRLAFQGTGEFLRELDPGFTESAFREYERTVFALQGLGLDVIIAHPERCRAIQRDVGLARRLARMGCALQVSADFVAGGAFDRRRRAVRELARQGLCSFVASDAHRPEDYALLVRARAVCEEAGT